MRSHRLLLTLALALPLALVAVPSAAAKKRNPYTAKEVCGSGYSAIDRVKLFDTAPNGRRYHLSTMVLMYNPSNGYNCATNLKRHRIGKPDYIYISLKTRKAGDGDGQSNFKYFAGPAYVYARDRCIQWWGGVDLKFRYHHNTYSLFSGWRSNWEQKREWNYCD